MAGCPCAREGLSLGEMSLSVLRVIDASFNRTAEGLRLLEDVARLVLDDTALTERLKSLRHRVRGTDTVLQQALVRARNAAGDVGIDTAVPDEPAGRSLPASVIANSRRAQEALRTLEEMARLPEAAGLDPAAFRHARFELYELEQALLDRLLRRDRAARISGLYVIIDTAVLGERDCLEIARAVLQGGASVLQLRDKALPGRERLALARRLKAACQEAGALFVMNDYLDMALACEADGLHVGQDDLPAEEARRLLPPGVLLGVSVTTPEQAVAADRAGADYIAVGSIYPTSTKETVIVVGVATLGQVRQVTQRPLVAIGGITAEKVKELVAAGADAVCVISAVLNAPSPGAAARQFSQRLEEARG